MMASAICMAQIASLRLVAPSHCLVWRLSGCPAVQLSGVPAFRAGAKLVDLSTSASTSLAAASRSILKPDCCYSLRLRLLLRPCYDELLLIVAGRPPSPSAARHRPSAPRSARQALRGSGAWRHLPRAARASGALFVSTQSAARTAPLSSRPAGPGETKSANSTCSLERAERPAHLIAPKTPLLAPNERGGSAIAKFSIERLRPNDCNRLPGCALAPPHCAGWGG